MGPLEIAAANAARRLKEQTIAGLVARVRGLEDDYTGDSVVHLELTEAERLLASELRAHIPSWTFYVNTAGRLYMGTADQVEAQQRLDGVLPTQTDTVTPVRPPTVTLSVEPRLPLPNVPTVPAVTLPVQPRQEVKVAPLPVVPARPKEVAVVPSGARVKFGVNQVEHGTERKSTVPARTVIEQVLEYKVEACAAGDTTELVRPMGFHAVIEAAHQAFASHYGLELSPDDIWVMIAQGFARLVNKEPEKYRDQFVTHQGKAKIEIRRDGFTMGNPNNAWAGCFDEFSLRIGEHIGADNHRLMVSDFSTTGDIERAVSNLVLMDTVQSYFTYVVSTRCGIPFITLRGSAADWQKVLDKARGLASFGDLKFWLDDLLPILQQFVNAASGKVDVEFWGSIYKYNSGSGHVDLTGWLLKLLPLVKDYGPNRREGLIDVVNPMLGKPLSAHGKRGGNGLLVAQDSSYGGAQIDKGREGVVRTDRLPSSLSTVPFIWDYYGVKHDYKFVGGHVGVAQNKDDLAMRPQMGWAVFPASAQKVECSRW